MIEMFLWLLFAHYLFDFSFQTSFMSEWKQKSLYVMFVHVVIWTGGICLAMRLLSIPIQPIILFMLFLVHYVTDWGKCKLLKYEMFQSPEAVSQLFMVDQLIHVGQLMVVLGSIPK